MTERKAKKILRKKYRKWREDNNYSGLISEPEVAHFGMNILQEAKEVYENEK